ATACCSPTRPRPRTSAPRTSCSACSTRWKFPETNAKKEKRNAKKRPGRRDSSHRSVFAFLIPHFAFPMIPSEILRKVRQIEIRARGTVDSVLSGAYSSSFRGRGMEFAEVREYVPGDEVRAIDWNVTARQGHPFVKTYTEERELTVLLMVDASGSGEFGSRREMKGELMATLSALLAFSAVRNNDRVGLLVFTSEVERFIPPRKGRKHVLRVIRELLYHKPRRRGTDLAGAIAHADRLLSRRAVGVLVADFDAPDFARSLRLLQRNHDAV